MNFYLREISVKKNKDMFSYRMPVGDKSTMRFPLDVIRRSYGCGNNLDKFHWIFVPASVDRDTGNLKKGEYELDAERFGSQGPQIKSASAVANCVGGTSLLVPSWWRNRQRHKHHEPEFLHSFKSRYGGESEDVYKGALGPLVAEAERFEGHYRDYASYETKEEVEKSTMQIEYAGNLLSEQGSFILWEMEDRSMIEFESAVCRKYDTFTWETGDGKEYEGFVDLAVVRPQVAKDVWEMMEEEKKPPYSQLVIHR